MAKSSAAKVLEKRNLEPVEDKESDVAPLVEVKELPESAPEEVKEPPKKFKKSPYPEGTQLFTYQPKNEKAENIQLPMEFDRPNKLWLWEQSKTPYLSQTWAWLNRAGVPDSVQRQCVSLPDDEYFEMFTQWFKAMGGGATPGE